MGLYGNAPCPRDDAGSLETDEYAKEDQYRAADDVGDFVFAAEKLVDAFAREQAKQRDPKRAQGDDAKANIDLIIRGRVDIRADRDPDGESVNRICDRLKEDRAEGEFALDGLIGFYEGTDAFVGHFGADDGEQY